jgi:hypothetical protein
MRLMKRSAGTGEAHAYQTNVVFHGTILLNFFYVAALCLSFSADRDQISILMERFHSLL